MNGLGQSPESGPSFGSGRGPRGSYRQDAKKSGSFHQINGRTGLKVVPVVGAVDTTGFSLWTRFGRRCIKLDWGREKERRTLEIARPDCTVSVRVSFGCLDVPLPIDYCVGAPSWSWMEELGAAGVAWNLGIWMPGEPGTCCLAAVLPVRMLMGIPFQGG